MTVDEALDAFRRERYGEQEDEIRYFFRKWPHIVHLSREAYLAACKDTKKTRAFFEPLEPDDAEWPYACCVLCYCFGFRDAETAERFALKFGNRDEEESA
jgi:hypothetical protein